MKGVKELKARIKSVTNIQKITRAMEMVASTKLRRLQDRAMATRPFADRIEAGIVKINGETAGLEPQVPFGGMKSSSSGDREQGKAAIEFFTQSKTIYVDRSAT